jgi:hypothetical protein
MSEHIDTETGEITTDPVTNIDKAAKLAEWYMAVQEALAAKAIIEKEQAIRKEVAEMFFPDPTEGTNTLELAEGYKLKLTHKIDRKIDIATLEAVKVQLREMGVNPDPLVEMKPSLVVKAYKGLWQVNKDAAKVFEQALTIKPASPILEIVAPKPQP